MTAAHKQIPTDHYVLCRYCFAEVTALHDQDHCGCCAGWWNLPCKHRAETVRVCVLGHSLLQGCDCFE